ncbi:MAG: hypothetical protein QXN93_03730 [Methanomassiliicoccales archaeon]
MLQLSPKDIILIHLYERRKEQSQNVPSETIAQSGISSALEIPRTHITRHLRPLIEMGMIEERKMHVAGKERRMKVYYLTQKGAQRVSDLMERILDEKVRVTEGGDENETSVADLMKKRPDITLAKIAKCVATGAKLIIAHKRVIWSNAEIDLPRFYGREKELATALSFFESKATVLVILANFGYGSSTMLKKIAIERSHMPLFWYDLQNDCSAVKINESLREFALLNGCSSGSIEELKERNVLLCFDNYCEVQEPVVDFFFDLMASLGQGRAKMAVAMGEETPSYSRFFHKDDVIRGKVIEIHLQRMDKTTAKAVLSMDLDDEAFQLIYQLTRGQPLALELVRKGDSERLSILKPKEEVRFLMYLRNRLREKDDVEECQ